jgi:fibronectin type 3 domain-containing protein
MKPKYALTAIALWAIVSLTVLAVDIQLQWDPVAPRAGETIGYRVYRQSGTNWILLGGIVSTNFTATNVLAGTNTYTVTATNQAGLESDRSNTASAIVNQYQVTQPAQPGNIRITIIITP